MHVHQSLEEGVRAFQSGRYDDAIALLNQALQADPNHPELHYWLAKAYQQVYQTQNAVALAVAEMQPKPDTELDTHLQQSPGHTASTMRPETSSTVSTVRTPLKQDEDRVSKARLAVLKPTAIALGTLPPGVLMVLVAVWVAFHPNLWESQRSLILGGMLSLASLTVGMGIVGAFVSRWLMQQQTQVEQNQRQTLQQQVEQLGQTVTAIADGKYHVRVPTLEVAELQPLSNNLNFMVQQVEQTITDLRNQQKALNVSAIVSMTNRKGAITYVNDKFCEISGYSRDELIGQNHRIVNSDHHPKEFFIEMWKTIASGRVWKGEIKNQRKHGGYYWVDSLLMPLFDSKNKICGYIGIRFDITERKQAEERLAKLAEERKAETDALRESEERFRLLITDVKDYAIIMLDLEGRVVSWNAGAEAIKGYRAEEIIGQHFSRFYPPEGIEQKKPELEMKVVKETGRFEDEGWRVRKDGSRFWANVIVTALRNDAGEIRGFSKVTRDTTSRKQAEEQLQQMTDEQERLMQELRNRQSVLDQAAIVSEADRKGNIIFINDKFCEISGYAREELMGKNHRIVNSTHHPKEFFTDMWKTIASGKVWNGEIKNQRKDGSYYWVDSTIAPILDKNGKIAKYVGIRFDITERKQVEERLENLAEERKAETDALTQQVMKLLGEIKGAAKGDLTVRAQVSNDVLGAVADSFNFLLGSLRKVVNGIQDVATQVNTATGASITDTKALAQQASKQVAQVEESLRQIERMVNSIKDVSDAAKRAEQVAQQAASTAEVGGLAVDRTVDGINELRQTIAETSKMMKRLGEGSQQIGKIVTSISQIASQTNLLALNATIEAARAGEQGQGFAVVAEEVRRLAERSASATEEISGIVGTIQDEISRVMNAMESGTQQVVNGTQLAAEAKTNLNAIIEVSREINGLIQNITRAAQKQSISAEDISGTVKQVSSISVTTAQKAEDVTSSLDNLAVIVGKLQESVTNFRLR